MIVASLTIIEGYFKRGTEKVGHFFGKPFKGKCCWHTTPLFRPPSFLLIMTNTNAKLKLVLAMCQNPVPPTPDDINNPNRILRGRGRGVNFNF